MANYSYTRKVDCSFEEAEQRMKDEFGEEGFGVLTEIDVRETFQEKLDIDYPNYKILGICNPPNAKESMEMEKELGLLLPCKAIVYEGDEGETFVSMVKPTKLLSITENQDLVELGQEMEERMERALDGV